MKVQAKIIAESERKWYGIAPQEEEIVEIRVAGWFPTEKFCGVKNRRYDYDGDIAKKSGILQSSSGTRGSGTAFFLKSKAKAVIAALFKMRNTRWENSYKQNGVKFETCIDI